MKRIIVLAVAAIMATMSVNAQGYSYYDTKHEVGISIGYPSTSQVFSAIADFTALVLEATMTSVVTGGAVTGYEYGDKIFTPCFSGEYYYHISKVVGIGGMLTYNNMHRDIIFKWQNNADKTTHQDKYGTATHHNISIIPTFKFDWLRTKNFGMYSKERRIQSVSPGMRLRSVPDSFEPSANGTMIWLQRDSGPGSLPSVTVNSQIPLSDVKLPRCSCMRG